MSAFLLKCDTVMSSKALWVRGVTQRVRPKERVRPIGTHRAQFQRGASGPLEGHNTPAGAERLRALRALHETLHEILHNGGSRRSLAKEEFICVECYCHVSLEGPVYQKIKSTGAMGIRCMGLRWMGKLDLLPTCAILSCCSSRGPNAAARAPFSAWRGGARAAPSRSLGPNSDHFLVPSTNFVI